MVRKMSTAEARAHFSDLLGSVYFTKEPVIVERKGKPFAVVISPDEYQRLLEEEAVDWAVIEDVQARNANKDPGEVLDDVTAEVEAVRVEHRAPQT